MYVRSPKEWATTIKTENSTTTRILQDYYRNYAASSLQGINKRFHGNPLHDERLDNEKASNKENFPLDFIPQKIKV